MAIWVELRRSDSSPVRDVADPSGGTFDAAGDFDRFFGRPALPVLGAEEDRNAVIHAKWYATDLPRHFYGTRSRRPNPKSATGLGTDEVWTTDQVLGLADQLAQATSLLEAYRKQLPNSTRGGRFMTSRKSDQMFSAFVGKNFGMGKSWRPSDQP